MENNHQNILLAVCGSISAYRSIDIARGLINEGHHVRIILSNGAEKFVVPEVYYYLGVEEVYRSQDDFTIKAGQNILHMDLSRWCDRFVIVPLSANTLAKLAQGAADDLITTVFLALEENCPKIIFPAMNSKMLQNPLVVKNIQILKELKSAFIHPPAFGDLACGDRGYGKLPDTEKIVEIIPVVNPFPGNKKKILIATGATLAPVDSVRYLTNPASGITGLYLAKEGLHRGYQVVIVAGIYATKKIDYFKEVPDCRIHRVITSTDAYNVILKEIVDSTAYLSPAAIGDIEFPISVKKNKKEEYRDSLPIKASVDILSNVLKERRKDQKIVGFSAETDLNEDIMREKWEKKPVDLLVGTQVDNGLVGNMTKGFINASAYYNLFEKGEIVFAGKLDKKNLACEIFNRLGL